MNTPALRAVLLSAALLVAGCAGRAVDTSCMERVREGASFGQLPREEVEARLDALTLPDAERAATIERLFREAGCETTLESIQGSTLPNVICRLPGRGSTRIVVGAHYDKADAGEGAADNWSGAALLPSLYRSLAAREPLHGFELIAFGAEEDGLVGSRSHVQGLDEAQRRSIAAMVNLDTLGLGSVKVEKRASDPELLCYMLGSMLLLDAPVGLMNADRVGTSDFAPFRKAGIPAISIHSITQDTLHVLHTESDRLSALDRDAYYETYRVVALYLALLDRNLALPDPSADAPGEASP